MKANKNVGYVSRTYISKFANLSILNNSFL